MSSDVLRCLNLLNRSSLVLPCFNLPQPFGRFSTILDPWLLPQIAQHSSAFRCSKSSEIISSEFHCVIMYYTNLNTNLINGQHGREPVRDGAHDRAEAPAGGLCAHASWAFSSLGQQQQRNTSKWRRIIGNAVYIRRNLWVDIEILWNFVGGHWKPAEICGWTLKS